MNDRVLTSLPARDYLEAIDIVLRDGHLFAQNLAMSGRYSEPELMGWLAWPFG